MPEFDDKQAQRDARAWILAIWAEAPEAVLSVSDVATYLKNGPHPDIPWADVPPTVECKETGLHDRLVRPQTALIRRWFYWWCQEGFSANQNDIEVLGADIICIGPLAVRAKMAGEEAIEELASKAPA